MFFVHSFVPPLGPATVATCDYGGEITAAIERDHVWGTQFHPEKSGTLGLAMLAELRGAGGGAGRRGCALMELCCARSTFDRSDQLLQLCSVTTGHTGDTAAPVAVPTRTRSSTAAVGVRSRFM